jgi:hypothetical protein
MGIANGHLVLKRSMVAFLIQLLLVLWSPFIRRARLEAENLILRQQLTMLRRKTPQRLRLLNLDRLLLSGCTNWRCWTRSSSCSPRL